MRPVLLESFIEKALVEGDFSNYFSKPCSSLERGEAIAVVAGRFERESRTGGEERGVVPVAVYVVREVDADAESMALGVERFLRRWEWERASQAWPWRVVGIDTAAPFRKERDSSGRFVWEIDLTLTVVRCV